MWEISLRLNKKPRTGLLTLLLLLKLKSLVLKDGVRMMKLLLLILLQKSIKPLLKLLLILLLLIKKNLKKTNFQLKDMMNSLLNERRKKQN